MDLWTNKILLDIFLVLERSMLAHREQIHSSILFHKRSNHHWQQLPRIKALFWQVETSDLQMNRLGRSLWIDSMCRFVEIWRLILIWIIVAVQQMMRKSESNPRVAKALSATMATILTEVLPLELIWNKWTTNILFTRASWKLHPRLTT